ncbi:MAG TPA: TIGR04282 family arsenosugar biosynthesis glycosyltransferase [Acidimicrobiia bacterium]|nr:TIGR04282 family arsenosugar biosynthesis glycosyltransferase [Acidimicrobiia bacterium]
MNLIVLAKAPVPGRVKTRLCPPCDPEQAAVLAEAALVDTLHAVAATPCTRRVIVLDGAPGPWLPPGFQVLPQRGDGLDERLGHAFDDVGTGGLLIGMDTPQVTPARLAASLRALETPRVDAVLGPAADGGWWSIGLRAPDAAVFVGVPMSTSRTGAAQHARLRSLGLRVARLPELRDVDDFDDALAVAHTAPTGVFAATLGPMLPSFALEDAVLATS